jgi:hypothetical protein
MTFDGPYPVFMYEQKRVQISKGASGYTAWLKILPVALA